MALLQHINNAALYFGRFTRMQNALIAALLSIITSAVTRNVWIGVWYIVGLYVSFYIVARLVKQTRFLHSEWTLGIIDGAKIAKVLIRNVRSATEEANTEPNAESTWEDLVYSSIPRSEAQTMIQCIARDFIHSWYHEISTDDMTAEELQEVLEFACNDIFHRIESVDKYKFLEWCISFYRQHLVLYQKAANKLKQQPKYRRKKSDSNIEFTKLKDIEDAFESLGAFHMGLKSDNEEMDYLLMSMRMALTILLPKRAIDCEAVVEALSQILARNILLSLTDMMCEPFWIHKTIIRIVSNEELLWVDAVVLDKKMDGYSQDDSSLIFHECKDAEDYGEQENTGAISQADSGGAKQWDRDPQSDEKVKHTLDDTSVQPEKEHTPSISSIESFETDSTSVRPKFFISDDAPETSSLNSDRGAQIGRRFSPEGESLSPDSASESGSQGSRNHSPLPTLPYPAADTHHSTKPSTISEESDISEKVGKIARAQEAASVYAYETEQRLFQPSEYDDGEEEQPCQQHVQSSDAADLRSKHLQSPTHIFKEVVITGSEVARERGGGEYTLYVVQYTANHKDETGSWTTRESIVKRRYREFVTLQDRLEEHPLYKKSMKGIWGPQRWTALPLRNMSESKVERRRKSLTTYLQALILKEDVGNSMALREFLAYEGDASLAFVRKAPEMPRIDKVLKKTFFGVVDKISSALPSLPSSDTEGLPQQRRRRRKKSRLDEADIAAWEDPDSLTLDFIIMDSEEIEDATSLEYLLSRHRYTTVEDQQGSPEYDQYSDDNTDDDGAANEDDDEFHDVLDDSPLITIPRSQGDGCDDKDLRTGNRNSEIPLAAAIVDLAVQLGEGREAWVKHDKVIHLFKVIFGRALNRLLQREIDDVTTEKRCTYIVYLLRETLWPEGVLSTEPPVVPSEKQKEVTRQQAVRCLKEFLPGFLPVLIGNDVFDYAIDQLFASVEHNKLNRHLVLCLLDHLLQVLIPQLTTIEVQQKLLFKDRVHSRERSSSPPKPRS